MLMIADGKIVILMPLFVSSYNLGVSRRFPDSYNTEFYIRLYNSEDHAITVLRHSEIALFLNVAYVSQPLCDKGKHYRHN